MTTAGIWLLKGSNLKTTTEYGSHTLRSPSGDRDCVVEPLQSHKSGLRQETRPATSSALQCDAADSSALEKLLARITSCQACRCSSSSGVTRALSPTGGSDEPPIWHHTHVVQQNRRGRSETSTDSKLRSATLLDGRQRSLLNGLSSRACDEPDASGVHDCSSL